LWSKLAGRQALVEWQFWHEVGNPEWLGFVAPSYLDRWQETQSVGVPAKRPLVWHRPQSVFWWAPVSGNLVLLWSMFAAGRQAEVE
jgi:hypothetical protein